MNARTMEADAQLLDEFSPVESSNLAGAGVLGEDLIVFFKSGAVYRYPGAADLFHALLASESKGRFFHAKIRSLHNLRLCPEAGCAEEAQSDVIGGPLRRCAGHAGMTSDG